MRIENLIKKGLGREKIIYTEGKLQSFLKLAHYVSETLKTTIDDLFILDNEYVK